MFTRIKEAWQVLRGDWHIKQKTIYVYDAGPENRFVQLVPWRDQILALDAQGKIWELLYWPGDTYPSVQLLMESPRSYQ